MSDRGRILVAGIGNIFLGDDAFGVEVVARLLQRPCPSDVRITDFGIRGMDLAYALEEHDAAVLIDATARGGSPGTLYVIDPRGNDGADRVVEHNAEIAPHAMTPDRVLKWIRASGRPRHVRVVGCEPESFGAEGLGRMGLSDPVAAALDGAIRLVEEQVGQLREACHA